MRNRLAHLLFLPLFLCLIGDAVAAKIVTCPTFERDAVSRIEHDNVLEDGAIAVSYGSKNKRFIIPYFSNIIALALVEQPNGSAVVEHWMQWYLKHLNWPDEDKLFGTVDDYQVMADGGEESLKRADSRDSYAGTFLSVAKALFENGNAAQRKYVEQLKYPLDIIGGVIVQEQQEDGLTWALPAYHVKYVLDNCEAYRGLADLSFLMEVVFNDPKAGEFYAEHAAMAMSGIEHELWDPRTRQYFIAKLNDGTKVTPQRDVWYPDAYVQVSPLTEGVLQPSNPRALLLYEDIARRFPTWSRRIVDPIQARAAAAYAGALLGDRLRMEELVANLGTRRAVAQNMRAGNIAEQAWLVRACMLTRKNSIAEPKK